MTNLASDPSYKAELLKLRKKMEQKTAGYIKYAVD
jgi:hypothetical protein